MIFNKPYSPRMVVVMLACFAANIPTYVLAQEVIAVVDDRVDSSVDSGIETVPLAPLVRQDQVKHEGWELGAALSAAYDSNIFLSSKDATSDMVYRLGPAVAYTKGDATEGEGAFIKVAYRPTGVVYGKNNADNRIDHQAAITAGWRGKVTELTYTGAAQKLGDATAETGRQTDRVEFENEIRLAWLPREKVTLEVAAGNKQADYADPTLYDSSKTYGEVAVRYAYSPKTRVGLVYQIGRFKVDGSSDQNTQQLTADIDWKPREKIDIKLEAGAEHRKVEHQTQVTPVVKGRVEWTPREGTNVYVTGYQRQEASAFYAGQNYNVKGATAGVSQRIRGNWSARLEGGVEKAAYTRVSGSGASGRKDRIWFIRPAIEYKISDALNVSIFYRASDNSSNDEDFGYAQRMAGIELNYKF